MGLVDEFISALKTEPETEKNNKTHNAVVSKIDDEGVTWVYVAGSDIETPTASTATEIKRGDAVNVEWRNNKLYIAGNYSDPASGTQRVINVENAANVANEAATRAVGFAEEAEAAAIDAKQTADSVHGIAVQAQADAATAKDAADNASEYAARALGNLSTVQSVTETLNWITAHGTMTLTSDVALDPTHVYFVVDAGGDYVVNGVTYAIVTEPDVDDIATYYELSIDESLNNYVGTHLALTSEGLWLLPASSGTNKVLIATGAGTQYTTAGTYIIDDNNSTVAMFGETATIGINDGTQSYLYEDYHSLKMIDKEGNTYFYISDLRDASGKLSITDLFDGTGNTSNFSLSHDATDNMYPVYINNVEVTSGITKSYYAFEITPAPASGAKIKAVYDTEDYTAKAYTLGIRNNIYGVGSMSMAEGDYNAASGNCSHAEGASTRAAGTCSHAEGNTSYAIGHFSHAEGASTQANGNGAHSEGYYTTAAVSYSHAEGYHAIANGVSSHAQNWYTVATEPDQTVIGKYNSATRSGSGTQFDPYVYSNAGNYAFIIGNGTGDDTATRSNALTVDWSGKVQCGNYSGTLKSIFDIFYPVGSYYETSLPSAIPSGSATPNDTDLANLGVTWFNPSYAWGGTWSLAGAGRVTIGAGTNAGVTYSLGGTGGSKDAVIPYHRHSVTAVSNGITGGPHTHQYGWLASNRGSGSTSTRMGPYGWNSSGVTTIGSSSETHKHDLPAHNTDYAGTSGNATNANMQPYTVVNRWHRTA